MDLARSLKPVRPADVERRLHEPPPTAVSEFLTEPSALNQEQVEHYWERGFVKLKQVVSGEPLRYFRKMIGYAVGHFFIKDDRAPADKRTYERSFLQADSLAPIYSAIRPFAHAFRFADLARRLMGIDGVRLWFDQALFKQPGGRLTDYHKDAASWPVQSAAHIITIWVALVDVPHERGCLAFAAGSHRVGNEPKVVDIFNVTEDLAPPGELAWQRVPLAAGDCTFHSGCVYPPRRCQRHLRDARGDDRCIHIRGRDLRLAGLERTCRARARRRNRRPAPQRPARQAEHPATGVDPVYADRPFCPVGLA